ncbi:hypothetical protein K503DRAFT_658677, partial [Rhizopogon vinicolor AM-OR11-026]
IIEGAHAQLIVQGIYSAKQSQSLHARENKKKTDRTMLFPEGKGRHLTEKEFIQKLEHLKQTKRGKEVGKNIRKAGRAARQTGKAAVNAEWQRLLQEYNMNIDKWSAECEELGSKNIPKKNWPKKLTRPLKPKM